MIRRRRTIGAKAFQFKLQAVLEMRIRQLEQVQQRFAAQQQKSIQIQTLIDEIRMHTRQQLTAPQEPELNTMINQQRFHYVQHLNGQMNHLQKVLKQEEIQLEAIRKELQQAHVQKKSLEKLSEKQRQKYEKAIAEKEEKDIEDLVMARRHRA